MKVIQNVRDKVKKILYQTGLVHNLSRQKFVVNYVQALVERGSVQSQEVAKSLSKTATDASNQRRIKRFFAQVQFEPQAVVMILVLFLPKGKLHLCLDRTEWDFGTQHGAARTVEYPNANGLQSRSGYTLMVAPTGQ